MSGQKHVVCGVLTVDQGSLALPGSRKAYAKRCSLVRDDAGWLLRHMR